MSQAFLVLGDQLFPLSQVPFKKGDHVIMLEDHALCTHFRYHKVKIAFFLTAMREYRDLLRRHGVKVTYYDANHSLFASSFWTKLHQVLLDHPEVSSLGHYEVADRFFADELQSFAQEYELALSEEVSPMFLTSRWEFRDYLKGVNKPFMLTFYSFQRTRLNLLMDADGKPEGGRWSYDAENRKRYPKGLVLPPEPPRVTSRNLDRVCDVVKEQFASHPGSLRQFWLPTTRRAALRWLKEFLDVKLASFGPYEDAIRHDDTFGFHAAISPLMNTGLLTPDEVVEAIVRKGRQADLPLPSIEGFVRQVIGWREFVRGIYDNYEDEMEQGNFWGHERRLASSWYSGETGIPPLDDSIRKAQTFGYTHHIERLMILSNLMLLSEIHPKQVNAWFMEMFVDSADWVMAANVYGMGQMSEGGIFASKPYICGSNYILKMSDYKKGDWCDTMDGLYWRFIAKHEDFFRSNPRLSMMTRTLHRMTPERKKRIFDAAEAFLDRHTVNT